MQKYWRHVVVLLIGVLCLTGLMTFGAMVLPQELHKATMTTLVAPISTPSMTATPSATPVVPTSTPLPPTTSSEVKRQWPKAVASPMSYSMVVNKKYVLSADFVPSDLRQVSVPHTNNHPLRNEAASALEAMAAAAHTDGIQLRLLSGYRSYSTQKQLYASYVAQYGQAAADRFSARPGHSEHQSGLTLDIGDSNATQCDIQACFATTPGGTWVAEHGLEFGYIIRYTSAKESVTGYMAEPWHIRYIGIELAGKVVASGLSLEEYLGVDGGEY